MLKRERQQKILQLLSTEKKVIASDLSEFFKVSEDTIRRDIRELDQKGFLERVHSGAVSKGPLATRFEQRQQVKTVEKDKITSRALQLLSEDTVILVDGSTTNLQLIEKLPPTFKATFITNSPFIAIELSKKENAEVILLGGILGKRSVVSLGLETMDTLSSLRVDTYLMGIYNIDRTAGITFHSQLESQIKKKMLQVSNEVIAMATSDKLGLHSNFISGDIESLDYLITDFIDEELLAHFEKKKVTVLTPYN